MVSLSIFRWIGPTFLWPGKPVVRLVIIPIAWPDHGEQVEGRKQEELLEETAKCLRMRAGNQAGTLWMLHPHYRCPAPGTDPPPLGRTAAGGSIAVSTHKASNIIRYGKKPFYPLYLIEGGTRAKQTRGHRYQDGGKKSKGCTLTHLVNVLASVFLGPSGSATCMTNSSTGPTHRLQEGVWSRIVARRKAEPPGWSLRGSLWFPKDGTLNERRNSRHCL